MSQRDELSILSIVTAWNVSMFPSFFGHTLCVLFVVHITDRSPHTFAYISNIISFSWFPKCLIKKMLLFISSVGSQNVWVNKCCCLSQVDDVNFISSFCWMCMTLIWIPQWKCQVFYSLHTVLFNLIIWSPNLFKKATKKTINLMYKLIIF